MCNKCDHLVDRFEIVGFDHHSRTDEYPYLECQLPEGHDGPHLIRRLSGEYIVWEYDSDCECSYCQSEDPTDHCLLYGEISAQEAEQLLKQGKQERE